MCNFVRCGAQDLDAWIFGAWQVLAGSGVGLPVFLGIGSLAFV